MVDVACEVNRTVDPCDVVDRVTAKERLSSQNWDGVTCGLEFESGQLSRAVDNSPFSPRGLSRLLSQVDESKTADHSGSFAYHSKEQS